MPVAWWMAIAAWAACGLAGCARESGPARYDLSGTVTFDGKPIPAGEISFAPDGSQGNRGPGSFAGIRDGRYATVRGKGVLGGPYVATVIGYDRPSQGEDSQGAPLPLFPTYQTAVVLPARNGTWDFDVPRPAR